jgi:hypothetical protein
MKDPKSRAQIKKFEKMAPLYEKHTFWDSQPVPKVWDKGVCHDQLFTVYRQNLKEKLKPNRLVK